MGTGLFEASGSLGLIAIPSLALRAHSTGERDGVSQRLATRARTLSSTFMKLMYPSYGES